MKYNIAPEIITDTPPIMGIPKEIPTLTRIQPVIDIRLQWLTDTLRLFGFDMFMSTC
jgi:hypothetical protein